MNIVRNLSISSLREKRWFANMFLALTIMTLTFLGGSFTSSAHAASVTTDPQVLIAVDITSPACKYKVATTEPGTSTSTTTTRACAPGTMITTSTVSLSQARAKHESYTMPLPSHASNTQWTQWKSQVNQLIGAKRTALRSHLVSPNTSCPDAGRTVWLTGPNANEYGDIVTPEVEYHVASDCSTVFLDESDVFVQSVPYNNPVWWIEFAYSYYQKACSAHGMNTPVVYELYPTTDYAYNPDVTEPAGLDAVYYFQSAGTPGCYGGGGPTQTVSFGPLN